MQNFFDFNNCTKCLKYIQWKQLILKKEILGPKPDKG
jgi:hypothetical protein